MPTSPLLTALTNVPEPRTELALVLFLLLVLVLAIATVALLGYRAANLLLRHAEERQRVVMDTLADGLITLDPQRLIRSSNRAVHDIFGWQANELLGRSINHLLAEPSHAQPMPDTDLSPLRHQVLQATGRHKDGHLFPVYLSFRRITLHGQPHHVAIVSDASQLAAVQRNALLARSELESFVSALRQHSIFSATDTSGVITHANPAFCAISGYSEQELIGKDHSIVNSGTHPREFWRDMWRTVLTGVAWHGEICNRAKDGQLYWVDSVIVPVLGDNGRITRIASVRHDITARKRYEQALEQTQKLLDLSNQAAQIGTWDFDFLAKTMTASSVTRTLMGFGPDTPLPGNIDGIAPLVVQSDAQRIAYKLAVTQGQSWNLELQTRTTQGELRWIRSIGLPEFQNGQCVRIHGIVQDIEPVKRREQELAEEKLRLTTLIESNRIGTWEYDRANQHFRCNQYFVSMLGYAPEELQDERLWPSFPPMGENIYEKLFDTLAQQDHFERTYRLRHKDGHWVWVQSRISSVKRDNAGQPLLLYGALIDVTELMQARLEAESAARSKDQFLATMSHELRTPLNAIQGFGQLLEIDDQLNADQQDSVQEILKASHHLLDLINDVLDLAKINAGRLNLTLEPVLLQDVLPECLNLMLPLAQARQITLDAPALLPQRVLADRLRLKQVLLNLLSNAVKYNRKGGRVTVSLQNQEPHRLRLNVSDTGVGIADEDQAKVFQPFSRVGDTLHREEGTGIGLNITRQLVEKMGGEIGISSEIDKGSTFWVEFQMAPDQSNH